LNKVILADNHTIFRAGMARFLSMEDDFRIVGQCGEAESLYRLLEAFKGATLLFASALKLNIPTLVARVNARDSRCIVIAESNELTSPYLAAGVDGATHRSVSRPALIDCARRVCRGERGVQIAALKSGTQDEDRIGKRAFSFLTPREMKIVALITQGYKNKEIAASLTTTEQVIKNYLRGIYAKTGVSGRLELALFAIHHRMRATAAAEARFTLQDRTTTEELKLKG